MFLGVNVWTIIYYGQQHLLIVGDCFSIFLPPVSWFPVVTDGTEHTQITPIAKAEMASSVHQGKLILLSQVWKGEALFTITLRQSLEEEPGKQAMAFLGVQRRKADQVSLFFTTTTCFLGVAMADQTRKSSGNWETLCLLLWNIGMVVVKTNP